MEDIFAEIAEEINQGKIISLEERSAGRRGKKARKGGKSWLYEENTEIEGAEGQYAGTGPNSYHFPADSIVYADESGSWLRVAYKETYEMVRIGSRLEVYAKTSDIEGKNNGRMLRIWSPRGVVHEFPMPMELMETRNGEDLRKILVNLGFEFSSREDIDVRKMLVFYLDQWKPKIMINCVTKLGWESSGRYFVLPDGAIGRGASPVADLTLGDVQGDSRSSDNSKETFVLQKTSGQTLASHGVHGTLECWNAEIGRYCQGNSRLAFGVSVALAATMLTPARLEGGGFHFRGRSSNGKTTTLAVAGSVCGGSQDSRQAYVKTWRSTDNALEGIAAQHNDFLLCLDEIGMVKAAAAGHAAYMLANGQGKSRAASSGEAKENATWNLFFLSSGEISLADKIAEDGKDKHAMAGQEIRLIDIPAAPANGFGVFEELHSFGTGAELSLHLCAKARQEQYGTLVRAWLEYVVGTGEGPTGLAKILRSKAEELAASWVPASATGQVFRVALKFAFCAEVGEAALKAGLLPWAEGQARWAAKQCFTDWLGSRGTLGNLEDGNGIRKVQDFLLRNKKSRFLEWITHGIKGGEELFDEGQKVFNHAGYWKKEKGGNFFYIFPDVFRDEICKGLDVKEVCKILKEKGMLVGGNENRDLFSAKLPNAGGSVIRCYKIAFSVLEGDEMEEES